jgi:hypothetical protein
MTTTMNNPNASADSIARAIQDRINEIEARRIEAAELEAAEADVIAQARSDIETAERRIKATQDRIAASKLERRQLELELARVEAERMPDRVTLDVARQCASDLLRAFGEFRGDVYSDPTSQIQFDSRPQLKKSLHDRLRAFWSECDRIRNRLLTTAVDDEATLITLAVEGLIHASERFVEDRAGRMAEDDGPLVTGLGHAPPECRHCELTEAELRAVLSGDAPPEGESIGELIRQGVRFEQVVSMLGLKRPNGNPCLETFARLIDGTEAYQDSFRFVRWLGCYSVDAAWELRQSLIPSRRANNRPHDDVLSHGSR